MGKTGFRTLIYVHILGVFFISAILYSLGYGQVLSYAFGGLIISINFFTLAIVLKAISGEKSVAFALLLVVFKYAILGYIIYYLVEQKSLDLLALSLGLGSLVITGPIAAILITKLARGTNDSL